MMKKILSKFENPKRPLLGPNIKALEFWGLLLPEKPFKRYFYIFMHINVSVFTASELGEVWFLRDDMNLLLNNLKITLLATISVSKVSTMLAWQEHWKSIIEYVTTSDIIRRTTLDERNKSIIDRYTKYSRRITYLHWALMYTTVTIVNIQILVQVYMFLFTSYGDNIINGSSKYVQVISSWVPFSKTTVPGFLATSVYQIYAATYGSGWITSFDTNAIVIMVFLRGELELLRVDSANIFGKQQGVSDAEAIKRLKDCHERHVQLMKADVTQLLQNFKISMMSTVSICKVTSILLRQKQWRSIIDYVTRADLNQRAKDEDENQFIIQKFTTYCRKITYLYWFLTYSTGLTVILQPVVKYVASPTYRFNVKNGTEVYLQVASSWVPFDKNQLPGYSFALLIQSYATVYASGWITSFDTVAIVIMVFFKGELELLRLDSKKIFGGESSQVNEEIAAAGIKECHQRHVDLVKYARLFDSCLSPIMLLYMFVCSVMLCATVYQITIETSAMQRFLTAEYLIFGIAQLFMYCWHSNDVLYVSKDLMLGPYESSWFKRNVSRRKEINILTAQFRKTIVFTAGPFTDLTVATFISILKGAYSYYTLLSQSQS